MMIIRPVRFDDIDALISLANKAGPGVTSFQPNKRMLTERINRCVSTFNGTAKLADQCYLFVLEESETGAVVGISGIEVAVGLNDPWYNFRIDSITHVSHGLGISQQVDALFLSNDHTGHSEVCTLFLDPEWRHSRNGQLLSKSRFLFLAAFKERFARKIVAEMRGISDEEGVSPFWDGIGNHFFKMDFSKADYLTGIGEKTFIAELMPRFPVYIATLPTSAQQAIGKVHAQTAPARAMLESEGFRYEGYVDIFDGGATLEAYTSELRIVRESKWYQMDVISDLESGDIPFLVSNGKDKQFRSILVYADEPLNGIFILTPNQIRALNLKPEERIFAVKLYK
jgi:arginine N-succinyltransferase